SLYGYAVGSEFQWFGSVQIAVVVLIAVGGAPWYAVLAALGSTVIPGYFTSSDVASYLNIAFGVFAILYAIQYGRAVEFPNFMKQAAGRLDKLLGGKGLPEDAVVIPREAAVGATTIPGREAVSALESQRARGLASV